MQEHPESLLLCSSNNCHRRSIVAVCRQTEVFLKILHHLLLMLIESSGGRKNRSSVGEEDVAVLALSGGGCGDSSLIVFLRVMPFIVGNSEEDNVLIGDERQHVKEVSKHVWLQIIHVIAVRASQREVIREHDYRRTVGTYSCDYTVEEERELVRGDFLYYFTAAASRR